MRKKILTLMLIPTTLIGLSTFAFSQPPQENMPFTMNQIQQHKHKNLNITEDQAKVLVEAMLIKFGKEKESILKVETINLEKNKNYYLVYLSNDNSQKANKFIIVDGQNGHTIPFPMQRPPMMKFKHNMTPNQGIPRELPPSPPEM